VKNFILGVLLTVALTPLVAHAISGLEMQYWGSLLRSQQSISVAEWQQVYWLKRQALAVELAADCGETLIEPTKSVYE